MLELRYALVEPYYDRLTLNLSSLACLVYKHCLYQNGLVMLSIGNLFGWLSVLTIMTFPDTVALAEHTSAVRPKCVQVRIRVASLRTP